MLILTVKTVSRCERTLLSKEKGGKVHSYMFFTKPPTYWMYLSETFWLCLVVMVRMYICRAASRSAAFDLSSGPKRSKITSLQLCSRTGHKLMWVVHFWGSVEAPRGGLRSTAPWLVWKDWLSTHVAWDSSKSITFFSSSDGENGNTEGWTLMLDTILWEKPLIQACVFVWRDEEKMCGLHLQLRISNQLFIKLIRRESCS